VVIPWHFSHRYVIYGTPLALQRPLYNPRIVPWHFGLSYVIRGMLFGPSAIII